MVLKPLSDSQEMLEYRDSKAPEFVLVANARLHQDLRRMNCTKRQNHLANRTNPADAALIGNLNARCSLVLESQAGNQCIGEHGEVWLVHAREDVRTENGLAFP